MQNNNNRPDNMAGNCRRRKRCGRGFTLLEVLTALAIVGLVSSSVLLVVNRCVISAANSALRMEAFTLVREHMEQVLTNESVKEMIEYGRSPTNPDIAWQTVIEGFPEPLTGKTWVRAVCSAEYVDMAGEQQIVKLEHWITELSDQQANQLTSQEDIERLTAEQLLETIDIAAEYAGVDVQTIEKWVENGLVTTRDGAFIKHNLDIYADSGGNPTDPQKALQVDSIEALAMSLGARQGSDGRASDRRQGGEGKDPLTGLPYEQLERMDPRDVMELMKKQKR